MEMLILLAVIVVLFPYVAVVVLFNRTSKMNQRLTDLHITLARLQALIKKAESASQTPPQKSESVQAQATESEVVNDAPSALDVVEPLSGWARPASRSTSQSASVSPPKPTPVFKAKAILEPDEHSAHVVTSVWHSVLAWFQGGNAIVRVGIIILLIGVVLLLRFASEHLSVSIEVRLSLVALGGLALTLLGIKLASKAISQSPKTDVALSSNADSLAEIKVSVVAALSRRGYALSLMGAGLAILYLTLFAAFRLYHLLPNTLTFGLLAVLAVITALLALKQDAFPLAFMAFAGAFLAPILTSDGSNNVLGLFSYYLLLNIAIAWLAHYRTWKVLNLLGAFFTFGLAGFWGWQQFQNHAWSTEMPFLRWPLEGLLIVHLALYLFIVVRYSQQLVGLQTTQPQSVDAHFPVVDGSLLFGVPVLGFGLQAGLLHDLPYALAVSSAVLAGVYLVLGRFLLRQGGAMRLLTEGTLAVGVGFLALVLPLALDAQWTSAGWAVQGAGLVWLGQRQQRAWQVVFGLVLQVISCGILFWVSFNDTAANLTVGLGVLAAAILVSAALLRRLDAGVALHRQLPISGVVLVVALIVMGIALDDVLSYIPYLHSGHELLRRVLILLLLIALGLGLDRQLGWLEIRTATRVLLPVSALFILSMSQSTWFMPLSLVWGLLGALSLMRLAQSLPAVVDARPHRRYASARIDQALWIFAILCFAAFEFDVLSKISALLPTLLLWGALKSTQTPAWLNRPQLLHDLSLPLLVLGGLWVWGANLTSDGQLFGLTYVPLINGLDITLGVIGLVAILLTRYVSLPRRKLVWGMIALAAFWSITGMVVRTLHAWTGSPLWPDAWDVDTVQSSLTIVWALLALGATWLASKRAWREVWLAGIALLGLVVVKLLFVDLSHVGAMARIISFICAGLIMLLIGYIAPLPPARTLALETPPQGKKDDQHG